jgi:poly-beta-1,6-N-acetyl-D-glucosamine synthase
VLWVLGQFVELGPALEVGGLIPRWHGVVLAMVCLLQFAISMIIDRRYEAGIGRHFYWMIWYPVMYWLLSLFTTLVALPKALLFRRRGKPATWTSPDRGYR